MDLVFVTSNPGKLREVRNLIGDKCVIRSLDDISWNTPIPETAPDLKGNALIKAKTVHDLLECDCFAEDTGLEVDALDGRPGVYSARYSGADATAERNISLLLRELESTQDRRAQFRTQVALILDGATYFFEGVVRGEISRELKGRGGFGYDPVFVPKGEDRSFAEMSETEKSRISHRGVAMHKLTAFLQDYAKCKSR